MKRFLLAIFAVPLIGLAFYAKATDDTELMIKVLFGLLFCLVAAKVMGVKNGRSTPKRRNRPRDKQQQNSDETILIFASTEGIDTGEAFLANVDQLTEKYRWGRLSHTDKLRLAGLIDARRQKAENFQRTPPIAMIRVDRTAQDIALDGTSWLGGAPALGTCEWPRDDDHVPMHLLAQVDLSELPAGQVPGALPQRGALAFFLQSAGDWPYTSKVIYVPDASGGHTAAPDDLPPIFEGPNWGYSVKGFTHDNAPRQFPRWPVEAIALPQPVPNSSAAANARLREMFPDQASTFPSHFRYQETAPDLAKLRFWHTAQAFANSLIVARNAIPETRARIQKNVANHGDRYQADLETVLHRSEDYITFVAEVADWAFAHHPWTTMGASDIEMLQAYFLRVKTYRFTKQVGEFTPFYRHIASELVSLDEAADNTLVTAAQAPAEVFSQLPQQIRTDIIRQHRLPGPGATHQMFGLGTQVQSAVEEHYHDHLLLQLHSDKMMGWMWGDVGVIQFWISDDALAAQDWSAVEMTIEGH